MGRFVLNATVVVLLTVALHVLVQTQFTVDMNKALKDTALYGHAFRNLTVEIIVECFFGCLKDCLCMAFQMCNNTECQLLSSNQFQTPSALSSLPGCSYYDMLPVELQQTSTTKLPTCSPGWNCCKDSNPCLNGGTCEPAIPIDNTTRRFTCRCPAGYTGNLCQNPIKSCRGYINGSRSPEKYKVFDDNMNVFEVFCDFDLKSTMTWTLIQSYQLRNKDQFKEPFLVDDPVNEDSPVWDSYRLSKSRIESIQQDSSKWRMTCRYDSDGVVYTDYVQATNDQINILTFGEVKCMEVEYIDIRGQNCKYCTALAAQRIGEYPLHFDSYYSNQDCELKVSGSVQCPPTEDTFGHYFCINPAHRCSATPTSTTQTWIGG